MLRTSCTTRRSDPPSTPDVTLASIAQLTKFPAEILHLVPLGPKHWDQSGNGTPIPRIYSPTPRIYSPDSYVVFNTGHIYHMHSYPQHQLPLQFMTAASTVQSTMMPAQSFALILLPLQSIATMSPISQSVASLTPTRTIELASLFNQLLHHATTTQAPAALSPTLVDDNADAQTTVNQHRQTLPAQQTLQTLPAQHTLPTRYNSQQYAAQQLPIPVSTQLQQQILRGEYVDFTALLDIIC